MSVNKVTLLGRLGADVEVRHTNSGKVVASLSLATEEKYKDAEGQSQTKTEWHKVVIWGRQAEIAQQYLKKGSEVYIEGRLATRKWQDANNIERFTTEVITTSLQLIGGKKSPQVDDEE